MTQSCEDFFRFSAESCRHFQKGEIIFLEGDPCQKIGYVAQGRITIRSTTPEGTEYLIQGVDPGQFFGDVMMFADESRYLGNVVAEADSLVGYFSFSTFLELLRKRPDCLERYLRGLALKTFELKQEVKLLAMPSLRERILFFLDSERMKNGAEWIFLPMTREQLAAKLGVCRPSLSRELSRMRKDGILLIEGKKMARTQKGHPLMR
jgi:CRP-like cAMP-binding protein